MRTSVVGRCKCFCRGQTCVFHLQRLEDSLLDKIGPTVKIRRTKNQIPRTNLVLFWFLVLGILDLPSMAYRPAGRGEHRSLIAKARAERVIELDLADLANGLFLAPRSSIPEQFVRTHSGAMAGQVAKRYESVSRRVRQV